MGAQPDEFRSGGDSAAECLILPDREAVGRHSRLSAHDQPVAQPARISGRSGQFDGFGRWICRRLESRW